MSYLDSVDEQLLEYLRSEARIPVSQLALRLRLSLAEARKRFDRLVNDGAITSFTIEVDQLKLGRPVGAVVDIFLSGGDLDLVGRELWLDPAVDQLFLVAGDRPMLAVVRCADLSDLRNLVLPRLSRIDGVLEVRAAVVLGEGGRQTLEGDEKPSPWSTNGGQR